VIANAADLAAGVSSTVADATTWVYGLGILAPATIVGLVFRVPWLHQPLYPRLAEHNS
jgi:hypothetical protein